MEPITITPDNIEKIFKSVKNSIDKIDKYEDRLIILPVPNKLNESYRWYKPWIKKWVPMSAEEAYPELIQNGFSNYEHY